MNVEEKILTVSQFNNLTKALIENDPLLKGAAIRGEISGFRRYPSGHLYFNLKDEGSSLSCVMFFSSASLLKFQPADGMQVKIFGGATVYLKDGRYQFTVRRMVPDGVGGLLASYEKLKAKLFAEGLFDEAHKKPLPCFPRRIGVITSPAGAALHDIISVTGRRFPCAEVLLCPSAVQGEEAPGQLKRAVEWFTQHPVVDVLIIGRGGGSAEDLWAFNDEALARALYACPIPTISAVGHEIDFTICDFVCDRRAPTPSAAAELAVPSRDDLLADLSAAEARLTRAATDSLRKRTDRIAFLASKGVLRDPAAAVGIKIAQIGALEERMEYAGARALEKLRGLLEKRSAQMVSLNPLAVLARGYGAVFDENGGVVRGAKQVNKGMKLTVRFHDGAAETVVEKVSVKKKS